MRIWLPQHQILSRFRLFCDTVEKALTRQGFHHCSILRNGRYRIPSPQLHISLLSTIFYYPMILLTVFYLCVSRTHTLAIPIGHPPLFPAVHDLQSILRRENAPSNTRTIWNIIFSCFSTLFACAWIAVHPNIPAPGDSPWKILRRRLMIMTFVLLAPEMVIIWAARQHRDANILARKFQVEGRPGWTKTHAFFLIMGGFTLHEAKGRPIRVLKWKDLETLATAGRVNWPNITKEEIKDRSKGDYLSKGIVVLQSTWFIVQFFARAASKLTITELEVVTLAFSTLIGIIYYLWWDKPLDVRCSVPVYLVELNIGQATSGNIVAESFSPKDICFCCCPLPLTLSPTIVEKEEPTNGDEVGTGNRCVSFPPELPSFPSHVQDDRFNSIPTTIKNSPFPPPQADLPQRPPSSLSWMKRLRLLIQISCRKRGTFLGLIYVFVILPTNSLLVSQFHAMMDECILETNTQEPNDPIDTLLHNGPFRVPTFYSCAGHSMDRFILGVCVSVLFGAMHCIAWYYDFPSSPERWGWRISSITISVVPLMLLLVFSVLWKMGITSRLSTRTHGSAIFHILHVSFVWPYISSRIVLLLFPLIALRALPSGAYAELDWATIIPHI